MKFFISLLVSHIRYDIVQPCQHSFSSFTKMPQTGKHISSQGGKSHGEEAEDGCISIFTVSVLYVWFAYLLRMCVYGNIL